MRLWFNKTFSGIHAAITLLKQGDPAQRFSVLCTHTTPGFPGFLAADEWALEPAGLSGEAYVDWCLEFARQQRVEAFLPAKEAERLATHAARFAAIGTRLLPVADADALARINDKARFCSETTDLEAPPPEFVTVTTRAAFDAAYAELRTRHAALCIKPAVGVYGQGFRLIDEKLPALEILLKGLDYRITRADLERALAETPSFKPLLLMEYLPGAEYSVDAVADQGRLVCAVIRQKLQDGRHGQILVERPVLHRTLTELARRYQLNGLFNAQFREDVHGQPRLLEINPRMSGGMAMTSLSGLNLPAIAFFGLCYGFDRQQVHRGQTGIRVGELALPAEFHREALDA